MGNYQNYKGLLCKLEVTKNVFFFLAKIFPIGIIITGKLSCQHRQQQTISYNKCKLEPICRQLSQIPLYFLICSINSEFIAYSSGTILPVKFCSLKLLCTHHALKHSLYVNSDVLYSTFNLHLLVFSWLFWVHTAWYYVV